MKKSTSTALAIQALSNLATARLITISTTVGDTVLHLQEPTLDNSVTFTSGTAAVINIQQGSSPETFTFQANGNNVFIKCVSAEEPGSSEPEPCTGVDGDSSSFSLQQVGPGVFSIQLSNSELLWTVAQDGTLTVRPLGAPGQFFAIDGAKEGASNSDL
ncbi:uncharacterized protein DSM5745_02327 [Aspergillus mulundensis]|uniref:Uncharacterized protein n=1 Tax=Aspergillus mulundensis TaxID=1810919 RepID=A0A3D8SW57_9EURO|nr:hypothetical protein DSM5745_02327 [Aspergillus mulundensis]RDW90552.1 hypothetical protein DSM5745_02327 [Aspergillus mulundensis]